MASTILADVHCEEGTLSSVHVNMFQGFAIKNPGAGWSPIWKLETSTGAGIQNTSVTEAKYRATINYYTLG